MNCLKCGGWAPADPETGYDGDDICPSCQIWTTESFDESWLFALDLQGLADSLIDSDELGA